MKTPETYTECCKPQNVELHGLRDFTHVKLPSNAETEQAVQSLTESRLRAHHLHMDLTNIFNSMQLSRARRPRMSIQVEAQVDGAIQELDLE